LFRFLNSELDYKLTTAGHGQVYPNENGDVMGGRKMSIGEGAGKREAGYDGIMIERPATA
jgi:hypothetical protein